MLACYNICDQDCGYKSNKKQNKTKTRKWQSKAAGHYTWSDYLLIINTKEKVSPFKLAEINAIIISSHGVGKR